MHDLLHYNYKYLGMMYSKNIGECGCDVDCTVDN